MADLAVTAITGEGTDLMSKTFVGIANRLPESVVGKLRRESRVVTVARPLVNRLVSDEEEMLPVLSGPAKGLQLSILPRREKFYWTGNHEPHVQHAIVDNLRPGAMFWDIGAHTGFFSLIASQSVGSSGCVHAFEPMSQNRGRLERSIAANDLTNVKVHAEAVAETSGVARLHAHSQSLQWSLVSGSETEGEEVACLSLDDLSLSLGIPDLIKIDAEGAELDVLRGGKRLLTEQAPSVIVEFTNADVLNEARRTLPSYRFDLIGQNHWLLLATSRSTEKGKKE